MRQIASLLLGSKLALRLSLGKTKGDRASRYWKPRNPPQTRC